ncbi:MULTISPECIES: nucleotide sugar dehydrogenase [Halomonas]|uniref:UDP-glucose 6-dehydrogenase n=1 Tax=Halomonas halophila TaxID=29573 RepID=A0ABQ0U011_9GAMM|nr:MULTISPECIES: nucleotide sugar dehydrogenase [Halomonas]MDR5888384.1 nucleotide sugar dehydrogenase [Halomonas salina]RAH36642.1 UDP-glucose/GDP-mannose dehydrogenase family protein [Halomonas sp. SL1]WJY05730.1 nucleotide sugar dehydrogenase [Halomonas halophila]GEK71748.1 UDP-glucose 6-dehydrogenase [Halomonas halophila]
MRVLVHGSELAAATAAAALASVGHRVTWWPHASADWPTLAESGWLASEPQLMSRLEEGRAQGHLRVLDVGEPLQGDDFEVLWLALSPAQREQGRTTVAELSSRMTADAVLVNNSTFPVGETDRLAAGLGNGRRAVALADLLEEGRAWETFTRPSRWLLGCDDRDAERQVRELLRAFNRRREVFQRMPRRAAELTKLAINGMLATRISYMNEIAGLADTLGVDVEDVREGMGADSRIGYEYLYPGCGFGGPSFSRDLMRLADVQSASGRHSALLDQVLDINEQKKETLFRKLWAHYHGRLEGLTVAIWGAAFKPGTARIDHAPVLTLLRALWAQGVRVRLHDPAATGALRERLGDHPLLALFDGDPDEALDGADALMLVTEWKAYWNPDWPRLASQLNGKLLLDGRNIYDPAHVADMGLYYRGIGRRADP